MALGLQGVMSAVRRPRFGAGWADTEGSPSAPLPKKWESASAPEIMHRSVLQDLSDEDDEADMFSTRSLPARAPFRRFTALAFVPERKEDCPIARRYNIPQREQASGGCGKVFVAEDRAVKGRMVAIKRIVALCEESRDAFEVEAQHMKKLDHPNICKIYETYHQGHHMHIVMEYCSGGEFLDWVLESRLVTEHTTAEAVRQVASAVKYAHGRGIAHRDLKLENICFCTSDPSNRQVKVIDWGCAFHFGHAAMNSVVGTAAYAAPEVWEADSKSNYSHACDLWSLGVLIYIALCGKAPFWGSPQQQLVKMKAEQYPMSSPTWQAISQDAKDLIKNLLKSDPSQRLSIDAVLAHPWLRIEESQMDPAIARQILSDMGRFSRTTQFFSILTAAVARQLDHSRLRDMHKVFLEMDTNGDGVLSIHEVRSAFEKMVYKEGHSELLQDFESVFERFDFDGSGSIDYTEFCAASMGSRMLTEVDDVYVAFKAFDISDSGAISKDEIKQVLSKCDVDKLWSDSVCEDVAEEIFEKFDHDRNGKLDFDEWLWLIRECARRTHNWEDLLEHGSCGHRGLVAKLENEAQAERTRRHLGKAFSMSFCERDVALLGGKNLNGTDSGATPQPLEAQRTRRHLGKAFSVSFCERDVALLGPDGSEAGGA